MDSVEKGRKLLQEAEQGMRDLMTEAASTGDYDAVMTLTGWASQLSQLAAGEVVRPVPVTPAHESNPSAARGTQRASRTPSGRTRPAKRRNSIKKAAVADGYPKFFRRADDLVKIGWSKRSKEEYQHKAPRHVLGLVADALAAEAKERDLVSAHDLTPLYDTADDTEVPGYQVYLCLAWLRQNGLIEQNGRQGYTVPGPDDLSARIEERWRSLPTG